VLALSFAAPAFAADLELRFGALERLISEQIFTQEGRHYVRGDAKTRCQYAYLEAPHIGAVNGRLRITARFSGRSALDVFGRCVGMGESFDFTLTAAPIVRKGAIGLDSVDVSTQKDSYYIRRVRAALGQSFGKDFKIDVHEQAKKLLEQPRDNSPIRQELTSFDLSGVQVTPEAIVLQVEFKLVVK
jgi:hypothetical protein